MLKKLRTKFICINMAIVTVLLCIVFCLIFRFTQVNLERESLRMMESLGTTPIHLIRPGDREVNLPFFILQIDTNGTILAKGGGYYDLSDREFLMDALRLATEAGTESGNLEEYGLRFLWVRDPREQKVVFADITSERATLHILALTCAFLGTVSFLALLGLIVWLSGRALKPVRESWEMQKQFVADASHELKTPLTVILTNAELLQSPEYTPVERGQFADSILQMSRQMRLLVERLLTLSRMDNNAANMVMEEISLSALVEDGLLPFEPLFFERGLQLHSSIPEGIRLTASAEHLNQVLDILLDNALKYSHSPGTVHISLRKEGNRCILTVDNPGPAIEKEDLQNIFKRFYRVDKARSRDGSTGLGLAIAWSIVTAHRGRIHAQSAGGRNRFVVELPEKP